jgi:Rod binding domain-containing protein
MSDVSFMSAPTTPIDLTGRLSPSLTGAPSMLGDPASVEKVAHDFESVLLQKVFEEMRKTVPESELLDSPETEQVQGLFWSYLAQDLAGKGGVGLWKQLAREINRRNTVDQEPVPGGQGQSNEVVIESTRPLTAPGARSQSPVSAVNNESPLTTPGPQSPVPGPAARENNP